MTSRQYGRGHDPRERSLKTKVFVPATLAVLALITCAPSMAAAGEGGCANEAIRVEQGSTFLGSCRAYEMISARDKNGNQVFPGGALLSEDAQRVLYGTIGGFDGAPTGSGPMLLATRTASGWSNRSPMPPRSQMVATRYLLSYAAPDLSGWIASAVEGISGNEQTPDETLLRLDEGGSQTLLHHLPIYFGSSGLDVVASDDLTRVFANVPSAVDPSLIASPLGFGNVYDFGGGTPELVSALPGTDQAPLCGVPFENPPGFAHNNEATVGNHWVSTDGEQAFFLTQGDDCGSPYGLYVRNLAAGTTSLVSGPPIEGATDLGVERFLQATPSGSLAYYRTATSLDPDDATDANDSDQDVYRWTAATGENECLTCIGVSAKVVVGNFRSAISEDGSHVYFLSAAKLPDTTAPVAGSGGAPNLYVWTEAGIRFIVRTDLSGITADATRGGDLTPDGNVLIFRSKRAELNAATGTENGGTAQYYRYDDRTGSLSCLSCPAGGPATVETPTYLALSNGAVFSEVRAVSDDGEVVFFPAFDRLVPSDLNGGRDLYEWNRGETSLVTNGLTDYGHIPEEFSPDFAGSSADGSSVLFTDFAKLTFDAEDGALKLYVARAGGGFEAPRTPAVCEGEGCLPPPSLPAGPLPAGSDANAGTGNLAQVRRPKRCHKGQRRVRRDGAVRCVKRPRHRANDNGRTGR